MYTTFEKAVVGNKAGALTLTKAVTSKYTDDNCILHWHAPQFT